MNFEKLGTILVAGIATTLVLTTVLGRKTTAPVINSFGGAISQMMSAALGKGVNLS